METRKIFGANVSYETSYIIILLRFEGGNEDLTLGMGPTKKLFKLDIEVAIDKDDPWEINVVQYHLEMHV